MVEVTEETISLLPEKVKETRLYPLQDYQELTAFFGAIKEITNQKDPYGFALDWEKELREHFLGTSLEERIDSLIVITPLLDLMCYEKLVGNQEEMKQEVKEQSVKIQQRVADFIFSARENPESLKLLEAQVAYLEEAFDTNTALLGYNRGLLNGIRGMVATMVAFDRLGYRIYYPPVKWDIEHDIDLVVEHKRTERKIGVSIQCLAEQEILNIRPFNLEGKPLSLRKQLDKAVQTFIPGPQQRPDIWKNDFLGIPNDYFVRRFKSLLIV